MIKREDIKNAYEIYLCSNDRIYVFLEREGPAYCFFHWGTGWSERSNESFWDAFESDMSLYQPLSHDEALKLYDTWVWEVETGPERLDRAIIFATQHHAGQFRKGTNRPYILHPIETLQILHAMGADTELMIAGVLHDTIEDTDATAEEIRELFGADVAELVTAHSEDKSKTWEQRKTYAIQELEHADLRLKLLVMADKVSNLRSIASDYAVLGDKVWERFNAPKEKQAWYYSGIADALDVMQYYSGYRDIYWEMQNLFKDVFVKFYCNKQRTKIYQICISGEAYVYDRSAHDWSEYSGKVPAHAEQLSRVEAESLEDMWSAQTEEATPAESDEPRIGSGASCFLVKDESLLQGNEAPFYEWLRQEGFVSWGRKGYYNGIDWVFVNLNSKMYAPGMPGIQVAPIVGNHAITLDEFKSIYALYQKYEGMDMLKFE